MARNPFSRRKGPGYDPYRESVVGESTGIGRMARIAIPIIIGVIIVGILITISIKIVDAGNRGVLLNFGAVDTSRSLSEGLHFIVPVRDSVVQMEVRTQKIVEDAASASGDLQEVRTQVALNYHIDPDSAQLVYKELGLDYANRVIVPAIQESVKQVTARYNAEELITQRESVKTEIEQQIRARLAAYNIIVDAMSITEFQFSQEFVQAIEAKVAAEQRALQAQNELVRIEIEAQQAEARAVGEQQANIARAEGVRQANVLQAQGEAQAITTIDEQLRHSPTYLEWLKSQTWDGQLPLVVGGSGVTPFIEIPTAESDSTEAMTITNSTRGGNSGSTNTNSSNSNR
jgi:regulator of protease activity HflC (stomatin/prohibitin superfamily)